MRLVRRLLALVLLLPGAGAVAVAGGDDPGPASPGQAAVPVATEVRVVSQTVGSDELLLALADPAQIAALSHIADQPQFSAVAKEAKHFPMLDRTGDAESVLKFRPTLVLFAEYSRVELVEQVKRTGVKVIIFERYKSLRDTYANMRRLARELGPVAEERAESIIADCEERVGALRARLAEAKPVRVIAPSTYGVIPGSDTTFQDLCDYAAAENLGATLGGLRGHEPPPNERMLTWPVDLIVIAGDNLEEALAVYRQLPPYKFMAAVREGRAVLIEPFQLSCVSHHRVRAYERLARELHPEVFR